MRSGGGQGAYGLFVNRFPGWTIDTYAPTYISDDRKKRRGKRES